jgi:alanine racemase
MQLVRIIKQILKREYLNLNKVVINKRLLEKNYKSIRNYRKNIEVAPVLKSNAYGHGLVQIAKIVDDFGSPFIIVDSLYEAYELKKKGIKTPILIIGYTDPKIFASKDFHFTLQFTILKPQKHLTNSNLEQKSIFLLTQECTEREFL